MIKDVQEFNETKRVLKKSDGIEEILFHSRVYLLPLLS